MSRRLLNTCRLIESTFPNSLRVKCCGCEFITCYFFYLSVFGINYILTTLIIRGLHAYIIIILYYSIINWLVYGLTHILVVLPFQTELMTGCYSELSLYFIFFFCFRRKKST